MKKYIVACSLSCMLLLFTASSILAQHDQLSDDNWNWPNSSPGIEGPNPTRSVEDVVIDGNTIYTVGRINLAGGLDAFSFAIYDDETGQWDATPDGPNSFAWGIDRYENRLYLGGQFRQVAGAAADYMVIWNMETRNWEPFNFGLNDRVRLVHISGDYLFIAGEFTSVGELQAGGIARYNFITGEWDNMGGGIPERTRIEVIESEGDLLYVGGSFPEISGLVSPSLAIYNMSSGEWSSLGTQATGVYHALEFDDDYIWIGGSFSVAPDGSSIRKIARYNRDTGTFSGIGPVLQDPGISIHSLLRSGEYLYAGGRNWDAVEGDDSIRNFARLHLPSEVWEPLADQTTTETSTFIGLKHFNDEILVYGTFPLIRGLAGGRIVSYKPEENKVRFLGNGLNHRTRTNAMHRIGDSIFLGGFFQYSVDYRAHFVGSFSPGDRSWQQVPPLPFFPLLNGEVFALLEHDEYLYVGGSFATSGPRPTNNLIRYDLASKLWESIIPEGESMGGSVRAFTADGDNLYIAGGFTTIAGISGNRIMRFNIPTGTYHPLGDGTNGIINDILIHDGYLYAAGNFTQAGGLNTGRVARYNLENESWEVVDAIGPNQEVFSLMVHDDHLYIGGAFTNLVESSVRYVAKRSLSGQGGWQPVGGLLDAGQNFGVRALAVLDGTVHIGGQFDRSMGTMLNNIARLAEDGVSWLPLGSGVNRRVDDLLAWDTDLWVSGRFTRAGNKPAAGFTVWSLDTDYLPPVSIEPEVSQIPGAVELHQNYPNPFNPVTVIGFTLPADAEVRLEVFNILGERVAVLADERRTAGTHQVSFNASRLSSGVYLYRLTTGDRVQTRKMVLIK